LVLWMD